MPPAGPGGAAGPVLLAIAVVAVFAATLLFAASRKEPTASANAEPTARYGYRVVQAFPHHPQAFTQGLVYRDGFLYEILASKGSRNCGR